MRVFSVLVLATLVSFAAIAETAIAPDAIADLRLPDVRITNVEHVDDHPARTAPHVKVDGIIGPAIHFELLLPDEWNGKFAMGGGGGLVGSVQNGAHLSVNKGYATVGTDTGHRGRGTDGSWAQDDMEALVNFGHVAIHRTAEVSKSIIYHYYGADPERSYFLGCSRGGGQAMMEAQRYPEDFDGIVAGAPAFFWNGFAALGINIAQTLYPDPDNKETSVLSLEDMNRLYEEIIEQTDSLDGVEDGIINDPLDVEFNLSDVDFLSDEQRAALHPIYEGVSNSDGQIYPGFPIGAEGGNGGLFEWQIGPIPNLVSLGHAFSTNIYKYFVFQDPDWDYSTYDFDRFDEDTRLAASILNATDPNLDAFAERGGKLILWHGWADAALPAPATIDYYEEVIARDPDATNYVRLFMVPGCYHCGSGPGVSGVDWLDEIEKWVEEGIAPEVIIATRGASGDSPAMERPLYPYPARAKYDGEGDPNKASSFTKEIP